jgi:NDP-sugar pyrophosphorylase family protein
MKIVVPMSGRGQRFLDAGYTDPKPLIRVDGEPIIKHVIDLFPGEKEIHCICNREHIETTDMRAILEGYGVRIHVIEPHSLGPVHAVSSVFDAIAASEDEEMIISYCDYGTDWDYSGFLTAVRESGADGGIAAYRGFHPHMLGADNYAFLRCDPDSNRIVEIREKEPFTSDRMSEFASNGTYYFRKAGYVRKYFTEAMAAGETWKKNGEFYVSLIYNLLVRDGHLVIPYEIRKMLQWGTPKDMKEYMQWSEHFKRAALPRQRFKSSATLVLPLAGRGSRFSLVGYDTPKPLLDVNEKAMIIRAVQSIPECTRKIFVCLNEHLNAYSLKQTLMDEFGEDTQVVGIQNVTEGQACTCEIGMREGGVVNEESILISACDNGVDYDEAAYAALEADPSVDVIVWSFTNNPTSQLHPNMYAWLDVDEFTGDIRTVSVKKQLIGAKHCIIGTMFFRRKSVFMEGLRKIYAKNIRTNGEFYVDDLLNPLIDAGFSVKVFPVDAYICWGTPNDYRTYIYWHEYFSKKYGKPLIM